MERITTLMRLQGEKNHPVIVWTPSSNTQSPIYPLIQKAMDGSGFHKDDDVVVGKVIEAVDLTTPPEKEEGHFRWILLVRLDPSQVPDHVADAQDLLLLEQATETHWSADRYVDLTQYQGGTTPGIVAHIQQYQQQGFPNTMAWYSNETGALKGHIYKHTNE